MSFSRRKFIQLSSLASASLLVPRFLKAFELPRALPTGHKRLIVIQLSGGNDGLNTVIPVRNDIYYQGRPKLAIQRDAALALNDDAGLHPALAQMKTLYDAGFVTILNGVGYPEPDRSHFRSMDIWQTGSRAEELRTNGWLGRYLDTTDAAWRAPAIEVDDTLSLSLKGAKRNGLAVQKIDEFHKAASSPMFQSLAAHHAEHEVGLASYLYQTLGETISSADYVYQQTKVYTPTQTYPDTPLGKRMKTIGTLINSGADTRVYYASHGSFDTHVGQANRQEKLLGELDGALAALVADLQQSGQFKDTLIMTFSEFGRRVAQNASNGTDHGTASCMFLLSGSLKKAGLYNPIPDLNDLDNGDLKYAIDFKDVYATVLKQWLDADATGILGSSYKQLGLV